LAWFFVNIGRADYMGSGIRNLYKYTKIYSGGEPELIEGDIFRIIIPLSETSETGTGVSDVGDNVGDNVGDVGDYVGDYVGDAGNYVGDYVGDVGDYVGDYVGDVGGGIKMLDSIDTIILDEIGENKSVSIPRMAEVAKRSTRTIERHLTALQSCGILRRVGSERSGHWEIVE
jgi:ATP-dependent DNA helicase RecG